jgi:hypothetical protein
MDEPPRAKGSRLFSISLVCLVITAVLAIWETIDRRNDNDRGLYLLAAVIAFGFLALASKDRK